MQITILLENNSNFTINFILHPDEQRIAVAIQGEDPLFSWFRTKNKTTSKRDIVLAEAVKDELLQYPGTKIQNMQARITNTSTPLSPTPN